jgi:sarcosine oxidase
MYSTIVHDLEGERQASERADVVVIGGGVVGAAAALALARRGTRVTLLERFGLAAARGSSAGTARIYDPAAYPDESYLEMGLLALDRWREIERASGEPLLQRTGALSHGRFAEQELAALEAAGVAAELVSGEETLTNFGVRVAGDAPLLLQPDAGVIRADRARAALLRMAAAAGAELYEGARVHSIAERGEAVEIETDSGPRRCAAAIVAAGPWSGELLAAAGIEAPLSVSCQTVAYFALEPPSAMPPALIEFDGDDQPYALWDPEHGLKAALHARGPVVDPDDVHQPDRTALDRLAAWVAASFPGAGSEPTAVETCLYTNTPEERFILEPRGRIVIASACNGQGFQFAPETGERVARLALQAAAPHESMV